jgi:hypothetical protein
MEGALLGKSASWPPEFTLTWVVVPVCRSRTKIWIKPLLPAGTRPVAADWKATHVPSDEIEEALLAPSLLPPAVSTLTRSVVWDQEIPLAWMKKRNPRLSKSRAWRFFPTDFLLHSSHHEAVLLRAKGKHLQT